MLEPPDITSDELLARVADAYGIAADAAEFLPLGADARAWAFRVRAGDDTWFLKVRAGAVDRAGLEVPGYLAQRGMDHLVVPVRTVGGASFDRGDPYSLIVYPFVDGGSGGDVGLSESQQTELGRSVRGFHDTPVNGSLASLMRVETFVPKHLDRFGPLQRRVVTPLVADRFQRELADIWGPRVDEIRSIFDRAVELGHQANRRADERVLCHGDIHAWNVLVRSDGGFCIVDWDETILAPRERDLMFADGGIGGLDNDGRAFFAGYGEVSIDPVVMAYYRFEWVVQELVEFGEVVFDRDAGDATRADAVASIAGLFEPDNVVEAASQADAALTRG